MLGAGTRRLVLPLIAIFAVIIGLEALSLVVVSRGAAMREQLGSAKLALEDQRLLAERYERTTYLALVGLTTSDWNLLLEERTKAGAVADQLEQTLEALREGGDVKIGGSSVYVAPLETPEVAAQMERVDEAWAATRASQVQVLRSKKYTLNDNPDLERFRSDSSAFDKAIEQLVVTAASEHDELVTSVGALEIGTPIGLAVLTILLALAVHVRVVRPLDGALSDLEHANADVREKMGELQTMQSRLVKASREAGMAEITNGLLHNVGNAVNSVCVSVQMVDRYHRESPLGSVIKLAGLCREHADDLGAFLTNDPRGAKVGPFIVQLGEAAERGHARIATELAQLVQHIEHVKHILTHQQRFARGSTVSEEVSPAEIHGEVVSLCNAALRRHGVVLDQRTDAGRVWVDKHKLLQIIVNLVNNAKDAITEGARGGGCIGLYTEIVPVEGAPTMLRIRVTDDGIGITPEVKARLFTHGFTTKAGGHGFGLHSSILAARELGGTLTCESDGPGHGARFELCVPTKESDPLERAA